MRKKFDKPANIKVATETNTMRLVRYYTSYKVYITVSAMTI